MGIQLNARLRACRSPAPPEYHQGSEDFFKHAITMAHTALRISTTAIGNAFERRTLRLLHETFFMDLTRVGGKGDGGIDLRGQWKLPGLHHLQPPARDSDGVVRFRVLAQCKAEQKKVGPKTVREMEGVVSTLLVNEPHPSPTLGILSSQSGFTKAALDRAASSSVPLVLIDLPAPPIHKVPAEALRRHVAAAEEDLVEESYDVLEVNGAWWNHTLANLLNHELELRRVHQDVGEGDERRTIQRARLWREGRAMERP